MLNPQIGNIFRAIYHRLGKNLQNCFWRVMGYSMLVAVAEFVLTAAVSLLGRGGDFNRDSMQICREMGMLRAAANYPSQARPWTNPFAIPRHLVRNWSCDEFSIQFAQFLTTGHF